MRIVHTHHPQAENLIHVQQMTEIRASEVFAGKTIAVFFDRFEVCLVRAAFNADRSAFREGRAVTRYAGRQHAVEHIDPARN